MPNLAHHWALLTDKIHVITSGNKKCDSIAMADISEYLRDHGVGVLEQAVQNRKEVRRIIGKVEHVATDYMPKVQELGQATVQQMAWLPFWECMSLRPS